METQTHEAPIDIATSKPRTPRKPKAAPDGPSEMQKLANLPAKANAFGRQYEIKRFSLYQIAQALTHITPLQYAVQELTNKGGQLTKGEIAAVLLASLSISGESIINLVSIATTEPVEWVGEQDDPIGAMEVLTAVVEKNSDFFSQENMDRVKGLLARLQQAIPALSGITSTP
jgi:hypothetical protein